MKRIDWADRQLGDLGLGAVGGDIHDAIWTFERMQHPGAPTDFPATHMFIVGPAPGFVTEALQGKAENSVACVNEDKKYDGQPVELWRMDGMTPQIAADTFSAYLAKYVPKKYGDLSILGFAWRAVVKELTGLDVENPAPSSDEIVCSQGGAEWMQMAEVRGALESWVLSIDVRDFDPLAARIAMLAHQ